jgi:phosphoglycolate phosphatase-like HAD superfamily hydrolase
LAVKMVAIDWDGTLVDTFSGWHPVLQLKLWFFKNCRPLYFLVDIAETFLKRHYYLHEGAKEFIAWARSQGMLVGIVTDRTLFAFLRSARSARFDVRLLDFIHARKSVLNAFVNVPDGITILETSRFKGEENALLLPLLIASKRIRAEEVLLIGDDKRDILAAAKCGFPAIIVDRRAPNFLALRRCIENAAR